jgi:hypothetical protein
VPARAESSAADPSAEQSRRLPFRRASATVARAVASYAPARAPFGRAAAHVPGGAAARHISTGAVMWNPRPFPGSPAALPEGVLSANPDLPPYVYALSDATSLARARLPGRLAGGGR